MFKKNFSYLDLSTKYNALIQLCVALLQQSVGYLANQLNQMYIFIDQLYRVNFVFLSNTVLRCQKQF